MLEMLFKNSCCYVVSQEVWMSMLSCDKGTNVFCSGLPLNKTYTTSKIFQTDRTQNNLHIIECCLKIIFEHFSCTICAFHPFIRDRKDYTVTFGINVIGSLNYHLCKNMLHNDFNTYKHIKIFYPPESWI